MTSASVPGDVEDPAPRFTERVHAIVRGLPPGTVASYGEVAAEAGAPGAARAVGRILASSGGDLPWWRVVTADGRLAPHKEREQARHLAGEGVACRDGHVVALRAGRPRRTAGHG